MIDIIGNSDVMYIRARWNQDFDGWSPEDLERCESYHVLEESNCILHMYREWVHDGAHWYPEGGKMYSRDYDFGDSNLEVKSISIPAPVHAAILEVARDISQESKSD